ncbi:MAG: hypothetical protein HYZ00_04675 [Candidatus Hydrogenedentes bacterium]|nr:hypothetical protein [Candidatus Hydrogenedentota bacterium]
MKRTRLSLILACALLALPATAQTYEPFTDFPAPAPGAFTVVGAALSDGRLAVWNGGDVFLQYAPDTNAFLEIASGYAGDPAFLLREPGGTLLLGAGFSGNIYRLDPDQPADYTPASVVINTPHYAAVLLTDTLLLVDAGLPGFTGSELQIVELSPAKRTPFTVVHGLPAPKTQVVEKPPFTYSAALGLDATNNIVYAMSTFGAPEELRYFTVSELLNAYTTATPLDWSADGTLIGAAGQFNNGGVASILANGHVVMPGFGSIQEIDPRLDDPSQASVVDSFDPSGLGSFYNVIFNPITQVILAVDGSGNVYAPTGTVQSLPAAGLGALALLSLMLTLAARRRLR